MKRYRMAGIIGFMLMFAFACNNNSPDTNTNNTDTLSVLPADTATPVVVPDTAIPRVDPALDSAARQMDEAIPPK